jgi:aspartyl-tRNA(Asn)/glutamyl-tRNA(Gln) amidotransferase subunit B
VTSDLLGYLQQNRSPLTENISGQEPVHTTQERFSRRDYISPNKKISFVDASSKFFAKLVFMLIAGRINSRIAKDLLVEVVFNHVDPERLVHERGLLQRVSEEDLLVVIDTVLKQYPDIVTTYKAGKTSALQFLIGQSMKATKGTGNPTVLKELLIQILSKISP